MTEKYQSRNDLAVENANLRGAIATMRSAEWSKTLRWLIVAAAFVLGLYFLSPVAISWAGKTTVASIDVKADVNAGFQADINKPEKEKIKNTSLIGWLGFIFGTLGILYGRAQNMLRKNVVERYQPYKEKYEKEMDEHRSSSNLTPRGETRPEDV